MRGSHNLLWRRGTRPDGRKVGILLAEWPLCVASWSLWRQQRGRKGIYALSARHSPASRRAIHGPDRRNSALKGAQKAGPAAPLSRRPAELTSHSRQAAGCKPLGGCPLGHPGRSPYERSACRS